MAFSSDSRGRSALTPNIQLINGDSYQWILNSSAAVFKQNGAILLDPPYDTYGSYTTWNLFVVQYLSRVWPAGIIMLWYPCQNAEERGSFHSRARLVCGNVTAVEFGISRKRAESLSMSGMLLFNSSP